MPATPRRRRRRAGSRRGRPAIAIVAPAPTPRTETPPSATPAGDRTTVASSRPLAPTPTTPAAARSAPPAISATSPGLCSIAFPTDANALTTSPPAFSRPAQISSATWPTLLQKPGFSGARSRAVPTAVAAVLPAFSRLVRALSRVFRAAARPLSPRVLERLRTSLLLVLLIFRLRQFGRSL